jgi:CubicO group peptidase (beta-lactamase class C family)
MDDRTIADLIGQRVPDGGPGLTLLTLQDGHPLSQITKGLARVTDGSPLRADTVFYVGSIAKQFVATCVAMVERDGDLSVRDPIAAYVDDLPAWGAEVRLEQLLHHISGLHDAERASHMGVPTDGVPAWSTDDQLAKVRALPRLAHPPGTVYDYSNRGYVLLATAVERAAGEPLAALAHRRIFEPLGMSATMFRDSPVPLPAAAARGHFEAIDGARYEEPARFHAVGAGGLWTTTADLARWDGNFDRDALTGGWLPERLTRPGSLNDGTPLHYAMGVSVRTHRGLPIVSHGGSFPGWESKMVRFPTARTTFICLGNTDDLDVSGLVFEAADLLLADRMDPDAPTAEETLTSA